MANSRAKTGYLHETELRAFFARGGRFYLHTFTFKENVTDKSEAMRCYGPVDDWYRRRAIQHIDTWERQKRGAWHVHVVVDRYVDVNTLRRFAVAHGFGNQSPDIQIIGGGGRRHRTVEGAIRYLIKYLGKQFTQDIPSRVRLRGRSGALKCGTTRFGWVNGYGRAWRQGCDLFTRIHGRLPKWYERRTIINLWLGYVSDFYGLRLTLPQALQLALCFDAYGSGDSPTSERPSCASHAPPSYVDVPLLVA